LKEINRKLISKYFNKSTIRNVLYFSGGIVLFIFGVIVYGVVLNLREIPLTESILLKGYEELINTNIIIERKTFTLSLYEDSVLIKSYRANFGRNISNAKSHEGDEATPVGEYLICSIDTAHKYHKFLRLNYPNLSDMAEGLRKGIISQTEYDSLKFDFFYKDCPELKTALGGNIGIHGIGKYNYIFKNLPFIYNWTDGSIAVSNEHIDEIYSVVKKGTKVVIK